MTAREQGFLLLTSHLGDPSRDPLTVAQLRTLVKRSRMMEKPREERSLTVEDLLSLGYGTGGAQRILHLLSQTDVLSDYLRRGHRSNCIPITRVSKPYPEVLRSRLGIDCPGCLWAKGDISLLSTPAVALVGSRDLRDANKCFAAEVGRQAAVQGYTLISGNARGADKTAQAACLEAGGNVIVVVADSLMSHPDKPQVLYLAEDGFDMDFSAQRALSRNRVIQSLGQKTFVAQCTLEHGGTWKGTMSNLRYGWTDVLCFDDGSEAMNQLFAYGAAMIGQDALKNISLLHGDCHTFFD